MDDLGRYIATFSGEDREQLRLAEAAIDHWMKLPPASKESYDFLERAMGNTEFRRMLELLGSEAHLDAALGARRSAHLQCERDTK